MTSPATASTTGLATDLRHATMRLARRLRQERAADDLSDPQFTVLAYLVREGAASPNGLAAWEHVSPPSMNRTINGLEEKQLVTRSPSSDDGRRVLVEATEAGRSVVEETRRRRDAWLDDQLGVLDENDIAALRRSVEILGQMMHS